jgi:hypothetical protein
VLKGRVHVDRKVDEAEVRCGIASVIQTLLGMCEPWPEILAQAEITCSRESSTQAQTCKTWEQLRDAGGLTLNGLKHT